MGEVTPTPELQPPLKSGFLTSEFATTVITQVIGLLVLTGKISSNDAPQLVQSVTAIFAGLMMITTGVMYIYSRYGLKKTVIENNPPGVKW